MSPLFSLTKTVHRYAASSTKLFLFHCNIIDVIEAILSVYNSRTGFRRLFMLSYQWFGSVGIIWTLVVGSIVSLLTGIWDGPLC